MSVRILGAGLVLATLLVVGGCQNSQSRHGGGCCQPTVAAAPGCTNCPPSVRPGALPPGTLPPQPVPGFAP